MKRNLRQSAFISCNVDVIGESIALAIPPSASDRLATRTWPGYITAPANSRPVAARDLRRRGQSSLPKRHFSIRLDLSRLPFNFWLDVQG